MAQQTIFNVPSADITPNGKNYLETESQIRLVKPDPYWYLGTFYARGVGANTEVDVTLFNTSVPSSRNITLGTGFKTAFPFLTKENAKEAFQFTIGAQLLSSFDNQGTGYWAYGHLSGKIPNWGTRLTAGVSTGTHQLFGVQTTGFIGGLEQPITPTVSWISDWYSGNTSAGFLTTGFSIGVSKSTTLYLGYQFPNASQAAGRQGATAEFSWLF